MKPGDVSSGTSVHALGLLVLRLCFGGVMLFAHGAPKLERALAGNWAFANPIGLGAEVSLLLTTFAEFFCAGLLALGVATRAASVPLIVTMFVAVFVQHAPDAFAKKELGVLYLCAYVAVLLLGPGRFALSTLYARRLEGKRVASLLLR
jgi:putative oxidoreductase